MRLFTLLQTAFTKIGTLMKRYNETADYVIENIADDNGWQLTKWNSGKLEGVRRWYGQLASTGAVGGFYYYIDSYTPPHNSKIYNYSFCRCKMGKWHKLGFGKRG